VGSRQLDRQWQPIQPGANLGDGARIGGRDAKVRLRRPYALDEQRRRGVRRELVMRWQALHVRQRQRMYRVGVFTAQSHCGSAGHQSRHAGAMLQERANGRRGLDDMLEIVQHKQRPPVPQTLTQQLRIGRRPTLFEV
jgi:hypothetical protein